MMTYELADIMFFITSFKNPHPHFNISSWVEFSDSATMSSKKRKLVHTLSPSICSHHIYFHRLPRL